ncbi:MAG: PHP domain-containing protein [Desulfotomaculaceae bacterium]|nr:PHP domain-containing protein [Desulfotomaculaceae bacterium]
MPVDMHVHTTASDGEDTPELVVARAKRLGLEAVAITDHDTVEGIKPAIEAACLHEIEVIPGIELSAVCDDEELHILGYFIDIHCQRFLEQINLFRSFRVGRMEKMVKKLQALGLPLEMEQVSPGFGTGSIGRPHLAMAMVAAGAVTSIAEAFDKYIGTGGPAYVPRYKLPAIEALQLIRTAGGAPVLAHPALSNSSKLIPCLKQAGLAGLEAYHPAHSRELSEYYCRLAQEHGLFVTGGSDYHGEGHKEGVRLGMRTVPYTRIQEIRINASADPVRLLNNVY